MMPWMDPEKRAARVLLILAVLAVICGGIAFGKKAVEYMESAAFYRAMQKEAIQTPQVPADRADRSKETRRSRDEKDLSASASGDDRAESLLDIRWEQLKGTDVVAWLQLEDVDYPVLQAKDNEYYLHRLPDGTVNYGGSLFFNAANGKDFADRNSFIFGHNMADGSMFGTLRRYLDPEYGSGCFRIYYPDGQTDQFRILSVAVTEADPQAYTVSFVSDQAFLEYQAYMKSISLVETAALPRVDARLVTLSTCFGLAGTRWRLLVTGQCLDAAEK